MWSMRAMLTDGFNAGASARTIRPGRAESLLALLESRGVSRLKVNTQYGVVGTESWSYMVLDGATSTRAFPA